VVRLRVGEEKKWKNHGKKKGIDCPFTGFSLQLAELGRDRGKGEVVQKRLGTVALSERKKENGGALAVRLGCFSSWGSKEEGES